MNIGTQKRNASRVLQVGSSAPLYSRFTAYAQLRVHDLVMHLCIRAANQLHEVRIVTLFPSRSLSFTLAL